MNDSLKSLQAWDFPDIHCMKTENILGVTWRYFIVNTLTVSLKIIKARWTPFTHWNIADLCAQLEQLKQDVKLLFLSPAVFNCLVYLATCVNHI